MISNVCAGVIIALGILGFVLSVAQWWQDREDEKSTLKSHTHFKFPPMVVKHKVDENEEGEVK